MSDFDEDRAGQQKAVELQSSIGHDEAAESRVRRKLDRHLMPLFFVLCK